MPEPGQGEQEVNALQARRWGVASVGRLTEPAVRDFLRSDAPRPSYPWEGDAVKLAADILEGLLPGGRGGH